MLTEKFKTISHFTAFHWEKKFLNLFVFSSFVAPSSALHIKQKIALLPHSILVTLIKGISRKSKSSWEAVDQMLLTTPFKLQPSDYVYISVHVCDVDLWDSSKIGLLFLKPGYFCSKLSGSTACFQGCQQLCGPENQNCLLRKPKLNQTID